MSTTQGKSVSNGVPACLVPQSSNIPIPSPFFLASSIKHPQCIVDSLQRLANMFGNKNILTKLDYESLHIVHTQSMPPCFNGDMMFILPPVSSLVVHTKDTSMDRMDKCYDAHVWTNTSNTNINNNFNLTFCSSICIGHFQWKNLHCNYLKHSYAMSSINDIEFDGFTNQPFFVGGPPPFGSTFVCKICKEPSKCAIVCNTRVLYVHGDDMGLHSSWSSQPSC